MARASIDATGWELVVERLTADGRELPRELRMPDWRFLLAQVAEGELARVPGRPALAKRWNCSGHEALTFLQRVQQAADSARADERQESGENRQKADRRPSTGRQGRLLRRD